MDSPSSGSQPSAGGISQMAFCHECAIEIRPLMTPDPTCPRCNGQFVEIIDQATASHPADFFDDPDDDDDFPFQPLHPHAGRAGAAPSLAFGANTGGQGLGGLLMALASGAARAQDGANRTQQSSSSAAQPGSNSAAPGQEPRSGDSDTQSTTRSGSTSFGPFGLQWNVQYGSGGGDPYQRAAQQQQQQQQQQQHEMRTPPTLSNFLRFAFGEPTGEPTQPDDNHVHDDGMGGAGSAADGRRFNHDNRGTYHQPPQSPQARTDELPPELAALRNLFTGLFGEPGAPGGGGGSLLDVLAAGAHGGPRGQWGDYVLGQQGLDDIISQLMEQTQGSNAPPPATEEVIEKLERFTRADTERIKRAKNQDCPTCKDDFLPSPGEEKQEAEEAEQQDELVSMPCAHIFHEDCLVPWLRLHGTCPVCRVSIAKPRAEGDASAADGGTDAQRRDAQEGAAADAAGSVPGGWPSPPNPFSAFFNTAFGSGNGNGNGNTLSGSGNGYGNGNGNGNGGGDARVSHDSRGTTTTTFQTQPPASTTITSTVYPSPPATAGGTSSGVEVNAIVSSPPLVDDRDDFFPQQQEGESRDAMRDRIRRATEARMGGPTLEPDELD